MSEPMKVSISPKAMSTEWCISASGGRMKPVTSSTHPKTHSVTDNINCKFFFIIFSFIRSHGSHGFSQMIFISLLASSQKSYKSYLLTSFAYVLRNLLPPLLVSSCTILVRWILWNVAVHLSKIKQRLIRVVVVKIQRSRFGCAQNVERW